MSPHIKQLCSLLTFLLFCIVHEVHGVHMFNVYRMLQFETVGQPPTSFGAQRTSLNSLATTFSTKLERLSRYIVMVPAEELTIDLMDDLVNKRGADGVVVLLPNDTATLKTDAWSSLEKQLIHQKLSAAVYFAFWDDDVKLLYEELRRDESSGSGSSLIGADSYRLEVPQPDASAVKDVNVVNIQGWLAGSSKNTRPENVPTIAVVAYTDSFGVAPALAHGADSNGSGMAALLEIARVFSKLFKNPRTQANYNLLFLLTGAGRMNFAGSKSWLDKAETRLLESIDFALCLDTIGSSGGLNFHVSRTDKDPKAKKIFEVFQSVADEMNIPFQVVHKKINVSSTEVPWEHEQFARKRVFSATLSGLSKAESPLSRADIADKKIDLEALKKNVKFVGESLARYVYGLPNTSQVGILSNEYAISTEYVSSWAHTISKFPRMMPFFTQPSLLGTLAGAPPPVPQQIVQGRGPAGSVPLTTPSAKKDKEKEENTLIVGLEKELSRYVSDVSRKVFKLPAEHEYVFFNRIHSEMLAFRGKPVMFDLLLSLGIFVYLLGLYTFLVGLQETIKQVKSLFQTNSKKKKN